MNRSRTHHSRVYDYSTIKVEDNRRAMRNAVVEFVRGIRGRRKGGVTLKQILAWFRGTPADYVSQSVMDAVVAGEIKCVSRSLTSSRKHNGASEYEVVKGE